MIFSNPDKKPAQGISRAVEAGLSGEAVSAQGVIAAIGGYRGIVESLLPPALYVIFFVFTKDARVSAIAPLVLSVAAVLLRMFRKEPLAAALAGLAGVLISFAAVSLTGEGSSYFVPGFFLNAAYSMAHFVALIIGWPLMGFVLGFFRGSLTDWKKHRPLLRAAQLTSILWLIIFVSRLVVQVPLYIANNVEALGVARLVMGVPLFAVGVVFTWLVLSKVSDSFDRNNASSEQPSDDKL